MKRIIKNKKGFTLIETIIYVGIIGLILSGFISFSVVIADSRNKNYVTQEVQANFRSAFDLITKKIKEADSINVGASTFNSDPGVLSLAMDDAGENPTIINLSQDDGVLQIKEGSSEPVAIVSDEIRVTNLVFTNLSTASPRENVRIELTLEFNNQASDVEFNYSESFQTAVSLRH